MAGTVLLESATGYHRQGVPLTKVRVPVGLYTALTLRQAGLLVSMSLSLMLLPEDDALRRPPTRLPGAVYTPDSGSHDPALPHTPGARGGGEFLYAAGDRDQGD